MGSSAHSWPRTLDDGEAAQVCERMIDLDEGVMEWRYRHVQMVRPHDRRRARHGRLGWRQLPPLTTLPQPAFPDLWSVRSRLASRGSMCRSWSTPVTGQGASLVAAQGRGGP